MNASELDGSKIYAEIVKAADDHADKDAAATLLEETKGIVLAELIVRQDQSLSVAAREYIAKADPVFRLHVVNMVEARRVANRAKGKYEGEKLLADMRRSEESSRRAAMRAA
jgi:hypothetical protein